MHSLHSELLEQVEKIIDGHESGIIPDGELKRFNIKIKEFVDSINKETVVTFGNCILHKKKEILYQGDEVVHLRPLSMSLLLFLVSMPGTCWSREQLYKNIWPKGSKSNPYKAVGKAICWLRKSLGNDSEHIVTKCKKGYMFALEQKVGRR